MSLLNVTPHGSRLANVASVYVVFSNRHGIKFYDRPMRSPRPTTYFPNELRKMSNKGCANFKLAGTCKTCRPWRKIYRAWPKSWRMRETKLKS